MVLPTQLAISAAAHQAISERDPPAAAWDPVWGQITARTPPQDPAPVVLAVARHLEAMMVQVVRADLDPQEARVLRGVALDRPAVALAHQAAALVVAPSRTGPARPPTSATSALLLTHRITR